MNCWGVTVSAAAQTWSKWRKKFMSGWETKTVCEQEGGMKKEKWRWIMMNGSAEDSGTSVATVWVSVHYSLSLSPVLLAFTLSDLITYCCSSPWPIKPYHWPGACQFYASALLIKDTHDTDTTMQFHSVRTPGGLPHTSLCAEHHAVVSVWVLVLLSCFWIDYESVGGLESKVKK